MTPDRRVSMSESAIIAEGLEKRFGNVEALAGVDFQVRAGSVFGLLGPNGAGKTTAVRILTTILEPDAGRATVLGHDVVAEAERVRLRIGLAGQSATVDPNLTGRENLRLVGRLVRLDRPTIATRASELLERFDLADAADRPVKTYSGGMRRRLDVAASLVGRPPVLFLDEPASTCGAARRCGTRSERSSPKARRSCSPRSTSRRPTGWPTASRSSTTAGSSPRERPPSSRRSSETR
jgi:ABC-type Na+ transport system ATPase subunit NatA